MAHKGTDFHLPDEILSVIPTDPYDQLDLARKITSMAIASRVSKLESEADMLRTELGDKDRTIADLQDQISRLDRLFRESEARLRIAVEENSKLAKDRDVLAMTSKKLGRDLAKLETFKRQLMQSLGDDNGSQQAEIADIGPCDQSIARSLSWTGELSSIRTSEPASGSMGGEDPQNDVSRHSGYKYSMTPHITQQLTPTATPTVSSFANSPRGFSTAGSSPKITSGAVSPTKSHFQDQSSVSSSSWYPSSQRSSTASSPPDRSSLSGRPPRIDGKEFFRQARSRLSYEQFAAFLGNIKELNAHRQSHEARNVTEGRRDIWYRKQGSIYILSGINKPQPTIGITR
ncbi:uncharacterized protein M6B38_270115 [Iris pallida]|uniref:At4g15545-like C-terminal domain-containing protein n=1 Tax=Iris pallida TaxID=29817 RepID=A0AAX6I8G9_IRIPA|nr:uncharacterized protein M6B38_270115 [Iris pallida]